MFPLFILTSCVKNNKGVPFVHTDIYINLSLPGYSVLNSIGGWVYISGGSKGIIVYRQTTDQFSAYDRHCTFNVKNPCGIAEVDSTNTLVECSCDGSKYQLYDGAVIQGPAQYSLQIYRTSFDPITNVVHIYN